MAYPTATDLQNYVQAAFKNLDFTTSPGTLVDFAGAIEAGIQAWESQSGYIPFLADSSDQTLYYNPSSIQMVPNRYPKLEFGSQGGCAGMISVTSVTVGLENGTGGTVLTLNKDYLLDPVNSLPYTSVQFIHVIYGYPTFGVSGIDANSIKVVGKRGYRSTLLASEKTAILAKGAQTAMGQLVGFASNGGVLRWKVDTVEKQMSVTELLQFNKAWDNVFKDALSRLKRTIFA